GPAVSLSTPAEGAFLGSAQPTFAGGAGNASGDSPNVTVSIYPGSSPTGTPLTKSVARSGASWSWAPNASELELPDGTYTAQAEQKDKAGNTGKSASVTFTIDTTKPKISVGAVPSPTKDTTPTLEGARGTEAGDQASVSVTIHEGASIAGKVVSS